ncbi:hypothetical protein EVAR_35294_1 [Eumeta japonica]|uniref:Uncharacterized protein n=1 Tax=Eumeta variegata TaxID=151549 RepID=A0A4C1XLL8_EUMVA|nr:hypothetical protein EVAR_35294_1 [Eumeta japonica]
MRKIPDCFVSAITGAGHEAAAGGTLRPSEGEYTKRHTPPAAHTLNLVYMPFSCGSRILLSRALSAATESRNSVTKIKPNTPHSALPCSSAERSLNVYVYGTTVRSSHGLRRAAPKSDEYLTGPRAPLLTSFNYRAREPFAGRKSWAGGGRTPPRLAAFCGGFFGFDETFYATCVVGAKTHWIDTV